MIPYDPQLSRQLYCYFFHMLFAKKDIAGMNQICKQDAYKSMDLFA